MTDDTRTSGGTGRRRRVLALCSSTRRHGNSSTLAEALLQGVAEAGHDGELVHISDYVTGIFRYCRDCRRPDGSCSIDDRYRELFFEKFLPADAIVLATPIWWYGMSGALKNFIDRTYCYFAESFPDYESVNARIAHKRVALILSAEESNFAARLAIVQNMSELSRYLHWSFVGVVTGIGNATGEAREDPTDPLQAARDLGRRMLDIEETDYKMDSPRSSKVWYEGNRSFPAYWR